MKTYVQRLGMVLGVFAIGSLFAEVMAEEPSDGLIVYYSFNTVPLEGRISDESGLGNDGLVFGTTHEPRGLSGGALAFNGISDYVAVINPYVIEPWENPRYTVSLWFLSESPANFAENRTVIADNRRYQLTAGTKDAQPVLFSFANSFTDCCTGIPVVSSPLDQTDEQWHHALLVVDEFASPSTRMYVDGHLVASSNGSGANHGGYGLLIGAMRDGSSLPGNHWIGLIDEVRIYDRVLTDTEVLQLSGRAKPMHETEGLALNAKINPHFE